MAATTAFIKVLTTGIHLSEFKNSQGKLSRLKQNQSNQIAVSGRVPESTCLCAQV